MSIDRVGLIAAVCAICAATTAMAQELMVFPNKDQSAEQQQQDKAACNTWAKEQSGFDPMAPPTPTQPPPRQEAKQGGVVRGAARGAAIGAIAGDTGKGAAIGAAAGGMRRQDQKRREEHQYQQWEQEQQRIYAEKRNNYNRAFAACLEAKDYTVR